jgi:AraC family transcriptional regulator of arabinose operon
MTIHRNAEKMHFRAISYPRYEHITPGHFFTARGYATFRQHGTPDWLLIYTVKGAGRIGFEGGWFEVNAGDTVAWAPGILQDYRIADGCPEWEIYWAHFVPRVHWQNLLQWPQKSGRVRFLHLKSPALRKRSVDAFEEMCSSSHQSHAHVEYLVMNALERALLVLDSANPDHMLARVDERIRAAMDYIGKKYAMPLGLPEIARECGLSKSRLSHLFIDQTGMTPMKYLEGLRISYARQLLSQTSLSIGTIAEMAGFESPYYFSRRFHRHEGCGPRGYRRGKVGKAVVGDR